MVQTLVKEYLMISSAYTSSGKHWNLISEAYLMTVALLCNRKKYSSIAALMPKA